MNIVEPILFQARLNPQGIAICTPGTAAESINYGRLASLTNNIGQAAGSLGLSRGSVVSIDVADRIFHTAIALGLMRVGIVTVSAPVADLPRELGIQAIITDRPRRAVETRVITADPLWTVGESKPLLVPPPDPANDVCRIIITPGNASLGTSIAFTHANMLGRVARDAHGSGNRFSRSSRLYCDLGIESEPGFRRMIGMLCRGGTIYLFGDSMESLLQAFDLHKVQCMIVAPPRLTEYVTLFEMHTIFQSGFDHILAEGGSLPAGLSERVRARLTPNLFCAYGPAETGIVALAPAQLIEGIPGAVGFLTPGAEVEVVDEADNVLAAGKEGFVRLRTPQIVSAHIGAPEASARAFRDGWFYPGDVGRVTADRMLILQNRSGPVGNR
jgi:acyl-CoA synthetase (AMP-forming)/AMP-acid ligase II